MSALRKKGVVAVVAGALALAIVGVVALGTTGMVSASDTAASDPVPLTQGPPHPGGGPRRGFGLRGGAIDHQALLADELGITVEALEAAQARAREAAIEQAVDEGLITEEQAERMRTRQALQSYLDRHALLAEALDMTPEALQDARADGETVKTLMEAKGLDAETLQDRIEAAFEAALAQAVADGVITQEQADEMSMGGRPGCGPREGNPMPRGPQGRGMPRGRGRFGGPEGQPFAPESDGESSEMGLRGPGLGNQPGGSDL
jgi:hypothetical protein